MIRVTAKMVLAVLFFCSTLAGYAQPSIAFLDAVLDPEVNPSVQGPVTERIIQELVSSGEYTVLDRSYVAQVLSERQFQLSGMVDNAEIKEAGIYLGATYVGVARVSRIGTTFFISGRIINVETGVITAQTSADQQGTIDVVLALSSEVGRRLAGGDVESLADVPKPVAEPSGQPSVGQETPPPDEPTPSSPAQRDPFSPRPSSSRGRQGARFSLGGGAGVAYSVGDEWDYWYWEMVWPLFSWSLEARLDLFLSEYLMIGSGVYLTQKGVGTWNNYYDIDVVENITYLQFPAVAKIISPQSGFFGGIGIGFNLAILKSGTVTYAYEEELWDYYFDNLNSFNISLISLLGYEIPLAGSSVFGFETSIDYHLNDDYDIDTYDEWWGWYWDSRKFLNWKLSTYISF